MCWWSSQFLTSCYDHDYEVKFRSSFPGESAPELAHYIKSVPPGGKTHQHPTMNSSCAVTQGKKPSHCEQRGSLKSHWRQVRGDVGGLFGLSFFYIETKAGVRLCHVEVGHVHSAAFVISDRAINHERAGVNAQWLCSAGGLSLWMPGLQPHCSTSVLLPLPLLWSPGAPALSNDSPCIPSMHPTSLTSFFLSSFTSLFSPLTALGTSFVWFCISS